MNKLLKLAGLFTAFSTAALAAPSIVGQIDISTVGHTVTVAGNSTSGTVTFVNTGGPLTHNANITGLYGDYLTSGVLSFSDAIVYSSPFSYSLGSVSGAEYAPLWKTLTVGNASFELSKITSIIYSPTLFQLKGEGIASLKNFEDTAGTWSFVLTRDTPDAKFSFTGTNTVPIPGVPDSGTTALLLGVGLMGLGFAARRMKR